MSRAGAVVVMTDDELHGVVRRAVEDALHRAGAGAQAGAGADDEQVFIEEVARMTGLGVRRVAKLPIPFVVPQGSRRRRYRRGDVRRYLAGERMPATNNRA